MGRDWRERVPARNSREHGGGCDGVEQSEFSFHHRGGWWWWCWWRFWVLRRFNDGY